MIEPHVNKQTHVLGGQGVIHSLLPGVLTDASPTQENRKKEKQSSLLLLWADSWYPPKHSYDRSYFVNTVGLPALWMLPSPSLCLCHPQPLR